MSAPVYELGPLIGRGRTTEVYACRHLSSGRIHVTKLVRPDLSGPETWLAGRMIVRAAHAAIDLKAPGIPRVIDVGPGALTENSDGSASYPYVVSEVVRGPNPQAPMPSAFAARVMREIAETLAAVHDAGLVLNGLRPGVIRLPQGSRASLLDLDRATTRRVALTSDSEAVYEYAAPEVTSGGWLTPKADVYAAGAVLYELLTGAIPFGPQSEPSAAVRQAMTARAPAEMLSFSEFVAGIRHAVDDRPRPTRMDPGIPVAFDGLLEQAMAIDPADRPDAAAFAEQLRGLE